MSAWESESVGSLSKGKQQVDRPPRSVRRQPAQTSIEANFAFGLREEQPFELPARLFEQLPFAVYLCDRDGVIVRYNRRAAELWGRSNVPP
jgi:PAS domain-containing protein